MKKIIIGALALSSVIFAGNGEELVKKNGCLACHAITTHKAAPPLAGVGMRNMRFEGKNAKKVIMNSIKNGSKGKYPRFANSAMPSYNQLSDKEISDIADYILSLAPKAKEIHDRDSNCKGKGMMGKGMGMHKGMGQGMKKAQGMMGQGMQKAKGMMGQGIGMQKGVQ